jgi:uncharacterized linocin/CFP29 family protein
MEQPYLMRGDAPVRPDVWAALDGAMVGAAKGVLAGRRILSIEGPYGLGLKVIPAADCPAKNNVASGGMLPLRFLHVPFTLSERDLASFERDHLPVNLQAVASAGIGCARIEDMIVFKGDECSKGLATAEGTESLKLSSWNAMGKAADDIIHGITRLDEAGSTAPIPSPSLLPATTRSCGGTRRVARSWSTSR